MNGLMYAPPAPPIPPWASPADALTWEFSTLSGAERRWRYEAFQELPVFLSTALAKRYRETALTRGMRAANIELRESTETCRIPGLPSISATDSEVRSLAERRALHCSTRIGRAMRERYCRGMGMRPPDRHVPDAVAVKRMASAKWWLRRLRSRQSQILEHEAIKSGLVRRPRRPYASQHGIVRQGQRRAANQSLLQALIAVNELGEAFKLSELVERSVADPSRRRAEMMCRIAGMEIVAREQQLQALLLTITCPSRMHAFLANGQRNPAYDGTNPREANQYLVTTWARTRAALQRAGYNPIGIRVAEPHHDGTPHWHLLIFAPCVMLSTVKRILRGYALQDCPDEPGAKEYRFRCETIDYTRGTATGYIAKYISKNIDGHGITDDGIADAVAAVRTWASIWRIRQFQFFGVPGVDAWRTLRAMARPSERGFADAWDAADNGDFASYVRMQGGLGQSRATYIRTIRRYVPLCDTATRLDPGPLRVVGIQFRGVELAVYPHRWRIVALPQCPPPLLEFCQ